MSLSEKIEASVALIRKGENLALALNPEQGYFVGFSGGKDSQVLLELVKMAGVRYKAYYNVTTNDPPDNIYFIRHYYPDVEFRHPKNNFFKLVEMYGLPTMRTRFCCAILKEGGGIGSVVLTGVRAEESVRRAKYNDISVISKRKEHSDRTRNRTLKEIEENEHRCIKGKDKLMIYPILHWTELEVWEFISKYNLPHNPCYINAGRVGCMFCPFSKKVLIERYAKRYPNFKRSLMQSLQKFINHYEKNKKIDFLTAEEYYDWWLTKKSVKTYKALKKQTRMEI